MNRNIAISIDRLTTGYRAHGRIVEVTRGIEGTIHSGELTCLLGPNGAGKSTLLRTLCGFQPAVSGDITFLGRPLKDYTAASLAHVAGVVLTERLTVPNMSVEQLVGLGRSPYTGFWGRLSDDDRAIVDEALSLTGVNGLRRRMVQTLSDGERQKVMIAKALAQQTPIIFLDEPTAFLDYPSKVEMMGLLHQLAHEAGKTVFMSTHDLELALQVADRLWLIDRELGLTEGVPEDLALDGSMERYFEREGIAFDRSTGLFRIRRAPARHLRLTGDDSPLKSMVARALERCGYLPSESPEASPTIAVEAGTIRLDGSELSNIAELLEKIAE